MIGRGAQGRPWVLAQVASELGYCDPPDIPKGKDLADMIATHYDEMLSFYGVDLGLKCARKHLGWYCDIAGTTAATKRAVQTANDPSEVFERLKDIGAEAGLAA